MAYTSVEEEEEEKWHRSWEEKLKVPSVLAKKWTRNIPYQQLIVIEPGSLLLYPHLMKLYTDTHYTQHKQPNDVYNPLFGCVWESFFEKK